MSEAPLMNNEAARSPTGEILDQATPPTAAEIAAAARAATDPAPIPTESPKPLATSSTTTPSTPPAPEPKTEAKPSAGAPEAYAAFTAPEGYTLDQKSLDAFTPIAKELGLSQEAAQRLVGFHAQAMIDAAKAPQSTYESLRNTWRTEVSADNDIKAYTLDGKSGLDAVKIDIGRALGTLDPKLAGDFRAAMDLTGAGDHPAFIKAIWKLSQSIAEGKPVAGAGPSPHSQAAPGAGKPSPAKSLYPNLA